ncbi:MAG: hypothetical protein IJD95_01900, partial [Clostridia bacterium]|nr:hypothetical protein [Clostridia bacterium]
SQAQSAKRCASERGFLLFLLSRTEGKLPSIKDFLFLFLVSLQETGAPRVAGLFKKGSPPRLERRKEPKIKRVRTPPTPKIRASRKTRLERNSSFIIKSSCFLQEDFYFIPAYIRP